MRAIYLLLLITIACNPIDDAVKEARQDCEEVIDDKIADIEDRIWEQCTTYYETVVLPAFSAEAQDLLTSLMLSFGCIRSQVSPTGWDCYNSFICRP